MHLAGRDFLHQSVHGLACSRHHHQAAGVFVQAVHDARAWQLRGLRIATQQTIEQRALPVAGGGVHHQARRFVDDAQMLVLKHHVQVHGLGLESLALRRGAQQHLAALAGFDLLRGLALHHTSQRDRALLDELLQIAARKLRHHHRQGAVQPLAVQVDGHGPVPQLGRVLGVCGFFGGFFSDQIKVGRYNLWIVQGSGS